MKTNRSYSTADVEKTLFGSGLTLADYCISGGLPMYVQKDGPLAGCQMAVIIEIDELATACIDYLRKHGAPEGPDLPSSTKKP